MLRQQIILLFLVCIFGFWILSFGLIAFCVLFHLKWGVFWCIMVVGGKKWGKVGKTVDNLLKSQDVYRRISPQH